MIYINIKLTKLVKEGTNIPQMEVGVFFNALTISSMGKINYIFIGTRGEADIIRNIEKLFQEASLNKLR